MKKISTGADNGGTDMSHDPFQEREAEKYANPIPSREFIIEHLTKREKPANREELAVFWLKLYKRKLRCRTVDLDY